MSEMLDLNEARMNDVDLRVEVDGIVSIADPFGWTVQPMIAIFDDGYPRLGAEMFCSNPPTEDEINAWIRGEVDL